MNRYTSQRGSTHVVIVICLVLALVTALGWIFYQNFIYKEMSQRNTDLLVVEKGKNKDDADADKKPADNSRDAVYQTYGGDTFTFQYPKTGWERNSKALGEGEEADAITTTDYKLGHTTYALESGARIAVYTQDIAKAPEFKKPTSQDAHGISNVQVLSVDGRTAYFHRMEYEGIHYYVNFQSDKLDYMIELIADGEATRAEKDVFNQVWKTFDIK